MNELFKTVYTYTNEEEEKLAEHDEKVASFLSRGFKLFSNHITFDRDGCPFCIITTLEWKPDRGHIMD